MSDIETKRHDFQSTMVPIFVLTDWWLSDFECIMQTLNTGKRFLELRLEILTFSLLMQTILLFFLN